LAQHIQDFCEGKARAGDGAFGIAFALLELARAQKATAVALDRLGTADAATSMGAIEMLSLEIKNGAEAIAAAFSANSD
jgi:hypothetical protein